MGRSICDYRGNIDDSQEFNVKIVKMVRMVEWFKRHFWLFVIIGLGLLLRLVSFREWLQFEFDEEVIAWKLRQFIEFGKPF